MELRHTAGDEAFLLDLLNSTPVVDGVQQDVLSREWLRTRAGTGSSAEIAATRRARDVLQDVVRGDAAIDALGPLFDGISYRPAIVGDGLDWALEVSPPRRLATRAALTWDTLRRTSPGRLRPCENTECALFLIDHSKPNKARWCSMAVCGNRMKARRHYERTHTNRES